MVIPAGSWPTSRGRGCGRERRNPSCNAATSRGFVAMAIDAYIRARILGAPELDERALLLVDSGADASRAHAALLHASARSPRPHLLLTLRSPSSPALVREARAAYAPDPTDRQSPHVVQLLARAARAAEFVGSGRHAAAERLLRDVAAALARRGAGRDASKLTIQLGRTADRTRPVEGRVRRIRGVDQACPGRPR